MNSGILITSATPASCLRKAVAKAAAHYVAGRSDKAEPHIKAALIDMDGVLYDSMKYHTLAWQRMVSELGIKCTRDEFYLYEGMTGRATIDLIFRRTYGHGVSDEEAARLYAIKARYFAETGKKEPMKGAGKMIAALAEHDIRRVLVTGSAQNTLISRLNEDYPGAFADNMRVTALDVSRGKPDPEPYLKGLLKAGVESSQAIVIENAPLGVRAGVAAGIMTMAVTTGPVPFSSLACEGASIVFESMPVFADALPVILDMLG